MVTLCLWSEASAEVIGDPELLRMVASGYAHNYQKLLTWQGKASIRSSNYASGNVSEETHAVEFLCDVSNDKLRWYWRKPATGGMSDAALNQAEYFAAGLMTGQTFWKLYPVQVGEPRPAANVHIVPRPATLANTSEEFSPLYYFTCIESDMYKRLMFFYENRNAVKYLVRIEREGNVVVISVEGKDTTTGFTLVNRHTFDTAKGYNLIRYYSKGTVTADWTFDYEEISGVWVPKSVAHVYEAPVGQLRSTTTTEFTQSVLNRPIDSNEFTIERLGLKPGDKVQDRISGLTYLYRTPAVSRDYWDNLQGSTSEELAAAVEVNRHMSVAGHMREPVNEGTQSDQSTGMIAKADGIAYWVFTIPVVVLGVSCWVFIRKRRVTAHVTRADV